MNIHPAYFTSTIMKKIVITKSSKNNKKIHHVTGGFLSVCLKKCSKSVKKLF